MARQFALNSVNHARSYLGHDVLGPRLLTATSAVAELTGSSAEDIFGQVDAVKMRSSMTLFAQADPHQPLFGRILELFFDGVADQETLRLLHETEHYQERH